MSEPFRDKLGQLNKFYLPISKMIANAYFKKKKTNFTGKTCVIWRCLVRGSEKKTFQNRSFRDCARSGHRKRTSISVPKTVLSAPKRVLFRCSGPIKSKRGTRTFFHQLKRIYPSCLHPCPSRRPGKTQTRESPAWSQRLKPFTRTCSAGIPSKSKSRRPYRPTAKRFAPSSKRRVHRRRS